MATWSKITEQDWKNSTAAVALDGKIFVMADSALYAVERDGSYKLASNEAWQGRLLAAAAGSLFSVEQGGILYRIDPDNGRWVRIHDDWTRATAAVGVGEKLYFITDDGPLFDVSPTTAQPRLIDEGPWSADLLTVAADWLFALQRDGRLFRIHRKDGTRTQLPGEWHGATAIAGNERELYVAEQDGPLYGVDPSSGDWWVVDTDGGAWRTRHLFVFDRTLVTIEDDGGLFDVPLDAAALAQGEG